MIDYLKTLLNILKHYHLYSITVIFNELFFYFNHDKFLNKIKIYNSNSLSNSIPCPYFFLKIINKFIKKKNINYLCDLGSGYGKILYFFGKLSKYKIDGVEINNEIFKKSKILENQNIRIIHDNILYFDLNNSEYDLFILNDPLKQLDDLRMLIKKLSNLQYNCYIVLINMTLEKADIVKQNLKVIQIYKISSTKNIYFCTN
jgi:SAM-dependent methyltransferase